MEAITNRNQYSPILKNEEKQHLIQPGIGIPRDGHRHFRPDEYQNIIVPRLATTARLTGLSPIVRVVNGRHSNPQATQAGEERQ